MEQQTATSEVLSVRGTRKRTHKLLTSGPNPQVICVYRFGGSRLRSDIEKSDYLYKPLILLALPTGIEPVFQALRGPIWDETDGLMG